MQLKISMFDKIVSFYHTFMDSRHKDLFILGVLLLLCLAFRLINYIGIGVNDDIAYIRDARFVGNGGNHIKSGFNQLGFRLGMVYPLALLFKLFGYNDIGFSIYPIICSLLTCAFIYLIAARLWGTGAAVISSLMWIVYPLQNVFDTQLSPSNQHATCIAASLFFYFYSIRSTASSSANTPLPGSRVSILSKWKRPIFLMICGISIGFGWWVNEIFITVIFIILPFLIMMRPKMRDLLWILTGFIFIMGVELIIVKISTGSWFARFTCILKTEAAVISNKKLDYLPRTLFKLWDLMPIYDDGHFGIIFYVFIVITVMAFILKKKTAIAFALGCWLWLAYLQWGVQSPAGAPIAKYIRYLSMIVPLQCLVFGAVLSHLFKFSKEIKLGTAFVFILFLIHLTWVGVATVNHIRVLTDDFKIISRYILDSNLGSEKKVYTDRMTGNFIEVFAKGKLNVLPFDYLENRAYKPLSGFLVKNGSRFVTEVKEYQPLLPEWYFSPPRHWPLIHTVQGKKIGVMSKFDPEIYLILP